MLEWDRLPLREDNGSRQFRASIAVYIVSGGRATAGVGRPSCLGPVAEVERYSVGGRSFAVANCSTRPRFGLRQKEAQPAMLLSVAAFARVEACLTEPSGRLGLATAAGIEARHEFDCWLRRAQCGH